MYDKNQKYQNGIYMSADTTKTGFYFTYEAFILFRSIVHKNIIDAEIPQAFRKHLTVDYDNIPVVTRIIKSTTTKNGAILQMPGAASDMVVLPPNNIMY